MQLVLKGIAEDKIKSCHMTKEEAITALHLINYLFCKEDVTFKSNEDESLFYKLYDEANSKISSKKK
jgi:hypothetical protein